MENKIKAVMADILEIENALIDLNTSTENVATWDSLKQIDLIMALEEEFDVKFSEAQMFSMNSYKMIYDTLANLRLKNK